MFAIDRVVNITVIMTLSAKGSRNVPKLDICPLKFLATYPSSFKKKGHFFIKHNLARHRIWIKNLQKLCHCPQDSESQISLSNQFGLRIFVIQTTTDKKEHFKIFDTNIYTYKVNDYHWWINIRSHKPKINIYERVKSVWWLCSELHGSCISAWL